MWRRGWEYLFQHVNNIDTLKCSSIGERRTRCLWVTILIIITMMMMCLENNLLSTANKTIFTQSNLSIRRAKCKDWERRWFCCSLTHYRRLRLPFCLLKWEFGRRYFPCTLAEEHRGCCNYETATMNLRKPLNQEIICTIIKRVLGGRRRRILYPTSPYTPPCKNKVMSQQKIQ